MLDMRKIFFGCMCSLALLASASVAGNVIANGGFATTIGSWSLVDGGASIEGTMFAEWIGSDGQPAGCARTYLTNTGGNNGHRFNQIFNVVQGKKYKLTGEWKGDLNGPMISPYTGRNWAEVIVFFANTPPTVSEWGGDDRIMYKKRWGSTVMNEDDGIWAWESFLSSPNTGTTYIPVPADGVFTATAPYMVVAFNLGGIASSASPEMPVWTLLDNVRVVPCYDENGMDCGIDMRYMAWVTSNWLSCNIDPATSCW
jgi:hypothetical protein